MAALGIELVTEQEAIPDSIQALVDARKAARSAKDWKQSDTLRDEIKSKGWQVEDSSRATQDDLRP